MIDKVPLPESFLRQVYTPEQLMQRLDVAEDEFWRMLAADELPPAVFIPAPVDQQGHLLWLRALIASWDEAGRPVSQMADEHTQAVLFLFCVCCEQEFGEQFVDEIIETAPMTDRQRSILASHGVPVPAGNHEDN